MDHAKVLWKLSSSSLSSWENGREDKRERAFIWALIFLLACFAPSLELCVCFLFLQVLDTNFSFLFPALCHPDKCTEHWGWCSVCGVDLQLMSNERFSSVVHRAVANSSEARLSMVFFCVPVHEDVLTVAEGLIDATHPARFTPFNWGDYLKILWKKDRPDYYRPGKTSSTKTSGEEEVDNKESWPDVFFSSFFAILGASTHHPKYIATPLIQ